MHPSAYTQRQNAAYARIEAAGDYLAQSQKWSDAPKLSDVGHPDANLRALLKLEAAADLVVRVAKSSGYEEPVVEPFKPNEFIVPPELAPQLAPLDETVKPLAKSAGKKTGRH